MSVRVHYVTDTLCGWCHGFSPVVQRLAAETQGQIEWTVTSGGLALDGAAVGTRAHYILPALQTVEQATGVAFGEPFAALVREGSYRYDSLPPARALAVYKHLVNDPLRQLACLHGLHDAIFVHGQDLNQPAVLTDVAVAHGAERVAFERLYASQESLLWAEQDFARARELGATGFPCLIGEAAGQWYLLARGYQRYESLQPVMGKLLQRAQQPSSQ